jgi:hypothetical protein
MLSSKGGSTLSRRINAWDFGRRFAQYALAQRYKVVKIARFPTYSGIGRKLNDSALPPK